MEIRTWTFDLFDLFRTFTFLFKHSSAMCLASLLCWKVKFLPTFTFFLTAWSRLSCSILPHFAPSICLSVLTRWPVPAEGNHPYNMMLPLTIFHFWGGVCWEMRSVLQHTAFLILTNKFHCCLIWPQNLPYSTFHYFSPFNYSNLVFQLNAWLLISTASVQSQPLNCMGPSKWLLSLQLPSEFWRALSRQHLLSKHLY